MELTTLQSFLGYATIIHIGILAITTMLMIVGDKFMVSIHSKLFSIEEKDLKKAYFYFLAGYKLFIWVFFLVPYIVLCCFIN